MAGARRRIGRESASPGLVQKRTSGPLLALPIAFRLAFALAACGAASAPTDAGMPTTRPVPRHGLPEFPRREEWKPGERIEVSWVFGSDAPASIVLGLRLAGPSASRDGREAAQERAQQVAATSTRTLEPLEADRTYTIALDLPRDLRPGYYDLVATTDTVDGAASSSAAVIVRVTAP